MNATTDMDVEAGPVRLAVTYREAAATLGVCERVVWQLVKDQQLKAIRIGRAVRVPVAELRRFVAERTATA